MTNSIGNTNDIIDVRDIIERVEELRGEIQGETPDGATWEGTEEMDELRALEGLLDDLKGNGGDEQWNGDWYPVTLIRDSYFNEAMDEMLEDIGDLPKGLPSYLTITIDYDALQQDYTSTEIDGVTYWYR